MAAQPHPVTVSESDILTFRSNIGLPMKNCVVNLEYKSGGYTGLTLKHAGKNIMQNTASSSTPSGIQFDVLSDGRVHASGTASAEVVFFIPFGDLHGDCYFTGCPSGGGGNKYDAYAWNNAEMHRAKQWDGSTNVGTDTGNTFYQVKITKNEGLRLRVYKNAVVDIYFTPMVCASTETDTTFEAYDGQSYNVNWQSVAGTVYGGTYDMITGVLTSKYASDGTLLSEPDVYELEPQTITARIGTNNMWCGAGTVSAKYYTI